MNISKRKKILLIIFILFSFPIISNAQLSIEWIRRYNATGNNEYNPVSSAIDKFGNIYIAGSSAGVGTMLDYVIIKYNSKGDTSWIRHYNGNDSTNDIANSICVDDLSNVFVTGENSDGITTVKYDSSGNFKWERSYTEINLTECRGVSIMADKSGNVYVLGTIWGGVNTISGYITTKYDSLGSTVWIRRYGNDIGGEAAALAIDDFGNIFITGYMHFLTSQDDYLTVKYNTNGDSLWVRHYNSGVYDDATSIAVDKSGNVYVTGESGGSPFVWDSYKYCTIKYDTDGNVFWIRKYDGLGNNRDLAFAIAVDNDGNVYVTGESSGHESFFDYATIKYNSHGDSLWVRRYSGPGNRDDVANSIAVDSAGNVYVTGSSNGLRTQTDYATIKYNPSGVQLWVSRYNGETNGIDNAVSVKLNSEGNIYVTGSSAGIGSSIDFLTIKYSDIVGINPVFSNIPFEYKLLQNYPNPFNPKTIISYQISKINFVALKIYDVLGNEVATLVNQKQNPGSYEVEFDGSNLSSGIYFYRIETGSFIQTKKMLLIK